MTLELNAYNWLLAIAPVITLLVSLLVLRWEPTQAGAFTWLITMVIAYFFYGMDFRGLVLANSKGMSVALYVVLIIWSALFLYNIVYESSAINVIGSTLSGITADKTMLVLLLAWCFTSLLQGLAGFGVPVAVVAPILVAMGISPLMSVMVCLIGHSWSISFGSMGSSYNAIQLVTGIPGEKIAPQMALLFAICVFATGFEVVYIYEGKAGLKKRILLVITTSFAISGTMWLMCIIGVAQVASLVSAIVGCAVIALWTKHAKRKGKSQKQHVPERTTKQMSFHQAALPYYLVIGVTLLMQIKPIKNEVQKLYFGLSYPATVTKLGYLVPAEKAYSKISWFIHPAAILFFAAIVGGILYIRKLGVSKTIFRNAAHNTIIKCVPTSVAIFTLVMMALIMGDSGMTIMIAKGAASTLGSFYPFVSPFIGVLGTFITDSNTNSNVMFGLLQYETGNLIGVSGTLLAAAQSVGGSLGVSIAPTTVMMNTANLGIYGKDSEVIRKNLKYCLLNAALVGVAVWLIA